MLTQERLKQLLHYDPESGEFMRLATMGRFTAGSLVGTMGKNGYIAISVDGKRYLAHRLAWLYVYGEWPAEIDHRNRKRTDNRLDNIRVATRAQNGVNGSAMCTSGTGLRGVHLHKPSGRYRAQIVKGSKTHSLGYFTYKEDGRSYG